MPVDISSANILLKGVKENTFDAIIIGSGISGGWAAKELCEHGLKTLVPERGRNIEHNKDYPTATKAPWEFKHRGQMTKQFLQENPLIFLVITFICVVLCKCNTSKQEPATANVLTKEEKILPATKTPGAIIN